MFKGYVLNIASWLLLRDVLRPVMLVAGLVCWRTWPVFFSAVGVLVPSMVAIELGFWVRGKIVPRYTEDQFARKSLRFKRVWSLVWWGIFIGLAVFIIRYVLE